MKPIINFFKAVAITFLGMYFLLLFSNFVQAEGIDSGIELEQVSIGFKNYFPGGTNYLITENGIPNRTLGQGISLNVDVRFLSVFYWRNKVHGTTDAPHYNLGYYDGKGQFRAVGYNFQLGMSVFDFLDVEYEHHSQHILDYQGPLHFPVEDSLGFKLYIYRSKNLRNSIF